MLYRVVTLTVVGNVEKTLYQDENFEACKVAADAALHTNRHRRVLVIDADGNHLYCA